MQRPHALSLGAPAGECGVGGRPPHMAHTRAAAPPPPPGARPKLPVLPPLGGASLPPTEESTLPSALQPPPAEEITPSSALQPAAGVAGGGGSSAADTSPSTAEVHSPPAGCSCGELLGCGGGGLPVCSRGAMPGCELPGCELPGCELPGCEPPGVPGGWGSRAADSGVSASPPPALPWPMTVGLLEQLPSLAFLALFSLSSSLACCTRRST